MRGINEVKAMEGTRAIHWLIFVLAHSHYSPGKYICAMQLARCRRLTGESNSVVHTLTEHMVLGREQWTDPSQISVVFTLYFVR